ncbi:hypothetical protein DL770_001672 [Monosporascus sp. CRB-9-2]|nr:hypothetical protein DL770_001672 [Monosporascus sp. CRB-9-2]
MAGIKRSLKREAFRLRVNQQISKYTGRIPLCLPITAATGQIGTWSSPLKIRTLKAEISARAALPGEEISQFAPDHGTAGDKSQEDDLGLQGVTIVMHMKDKDDLAIDAHLTRDQNGQIDGNTRM